MQDISTKINGDWNKWDSMSKITTDNTTPSKAKDQFTVDSRWAWNLDYLLLYGGCERQ